MTIFGPALKDLTVEDLERFLADAGPEPLLWEAKGIEVNRGMVRRQVCGFANSHDGGYLIIGASAADGSWKLDGIGFPDDPPTWISRRPSQARAHTAAQEIMAYGRALPRYQDGRVQFGLVLTASGYLPDIPSRLFSPAFEECVISCMGALDHGPRARRSPTILPSVTQDSRRFESDGLNDVLGQSWLVRATWHGDVGIYWVHRFDRRAIDDLFAGPVRQAWAATDEILGMLEPQGPRYLQLMVADGEFPPNTEGQVLTVVGRGPIDPGVDPTVLDSVQRELQRSIGEMAYES